MKDNSRQGRCQGCRNHPTKNSCNMSFTTVSDLFASCLPLFDFRNTIDYTFQLKEDDCCSVRSVAHRSLTAIIHRRHASLTQEACCSALIPIFDSETIRKDLFHQGVEIFANIATYFMPVWKSRKAASLQHSGSQVANIYHARRFSYTFALSETRSSKDSMGSLMITKLIPKSFLSCN